MKPPKVLVFLFSAAALAGAPRPVWIDTDPSAIPGGHDVDDALALLEAFGSPELSIRGISIVFGNMDLATTSRLGKQIIREFGPPSTPVFVGAAGASDLGRETDATRALADALRRERLTILALGPATNIATVVRNHPELAPRIGEIIAVAGRRPGQKLIAGPKQTNSFRDVNFELDPEAFRILLSSRIPLTVTPWEIASKLWLTREDVAALAGRKPGLASLLPAIEDWLALWRNRFGAPGFHPFDTLAVGYLVDRSDLTCSVLDASIETGTDDTSMSANAAEKPYLLVRPLRRNRRTVKYCHDVAPRFKRDLLRRIAKT